MSAPLDDIEARAHLVGLARGWLGTPFCHGASRRGAGCDCLGLILGLMREWRGQAPCAPPYGPAGGSDADGAVLLEGLAHHLNPVLPGAALLPGQVLLFALNPGRAARHLGLCSAGGQGARFIHAYGRHGVVESPLSAPWQRRLRARFDLI